MTAIWLAVLAAVAMTFMGTLILHKYGHSLRIKSQEFKFHELRDRLQVLAVEQKISTSSSSYVFLHFILNLCIRNAGEMKLSELLKLSKIIDHKMSKLSASNMFRELRKESEEVQRLAADVFQELGCMLIVNDGITRLFAKIAELIAHKMRGAIFAFAKGIAKTLAPTHTRAVNEALKYQSFSAEIRNAAAA